jgi:hypothetical protein
MYNIFVFIHLIFSKILLIFVSNITIIIAIIFDIKYLSFNFIEYKIDNQFKISLTIVLVINFIFSYFQLFIFYLVIMLII